MSRRRRKNKNGLAGKERNVYKQRRASATHSQRSVEEFHFEFEEKSTISRDVPISSRNDFLPSAEPDTSTSSQSYVSSHDGQLKFPVAKNAPSVMRIVKDDDQRPAHTSTNRPQVNRRHQSQSIAAKPDDKHSSFTWQGYIQGCAWGSAVAATILAALRIAS